jgi:hypothetical protein
MPGGWIFAAASYTQPNGGLLTVSYKSSAGGVIAIQEGAFCTTSAAACAPHDKALGAAKFGDLSATLDSVGANLVIYAGTPGTTRAYTATGTGVAQGTFTSIVAGLVKVPKS